MLNSAEIRKLPEAFESLVIIDDYVQLGGTSVQSLLCPVQSLLHNFAVCSLQSVRGLLLYCYNISDIGIVAVTPSEITGVTFSNIESIDMIQTLDFTESMAS